MATLVRLLGCMNGGRHGSIQMVTNWVNSKDGKWISSLHIRRFRIGGSVISTKQWLAVLLHTIEMSIFSLSEAYRLHVHIRSLHWPRPLGSLVSSTVFLRIFKSKLVSVD